MLPLGEGLVSVDKIGRGIDRAKLAEEYKKASANRVSN